MARVVLIRIRQLVIVAAIAAGVVFAAGAPNASGAVTLPNSMASLGDSITRGFNACGFYFDCTSRSWSTGSAVNSHYRRILAGNPAILGRQRNDALSGARASDLARQAGLAVGQGVEYVTIEIGANDACRSSESQMTPVSTFRAQIDAGLGVLQAGLPSNAQVFVASIPDVKRLWAIGRGSFSARLAWSALGICQSMLANPLSNASADVARRDRVQQRVVEYNAQLAQACAAFGPRCDFDDNAVFNFQFTLSHVSQWDYFHPNTAGQQVAAEITWNAGPFAG
ncbi:MAG: GDSL-type esterase/lipase family protein [Sporichthyaceae bacterium]|nr:GDSL-type esterase/lipase family protein [Sporichthyaceae bacterium]